MSESQTPSPSGDRSGGRLFDWLDRRVGIRGLLHEALDEPIPGGARLAYVFGSGLLLIFISQVVTGVFLSLYYVPSADHAHTTVAYIVKEAAAGSFLRSLHAYGSSAMLIVLVLHIAQTILFGSYKGTREILWLSGCVLFALILSMSFTGYLLPWDQEAYFATAVGTNILGEVPWIGIPLERLVRGGTDIGTLTVSRFFVAHVFLLPAAIFGFIAAHVYLFRKAGAAGPPTPPEPSTVEPFFPRQVVMDVTCGLLIIGSVGFLSILWPASLGPEANPADTRFLPRPEWYYIPVFQWLKYWEGSLAFVGIVVIPGLLAVLFAGLPFLDRTDERRPLRRPWVVGIFFAALLGLLSLAITSYRADAQDPAVAEQLAAQEEATRQYMEAPFEPEDASLLGAALTTADPLLTRGKVLYESEFCDACHGSDGLGTAGGPPLTGAAQNYPDGVLAELLRNPSQALQDSGMAPLAISDDDLAALVAYVNGF